MTNKPMLSVERDSIALEALKVARQFIANGIELGYIRMPEPETPDSAHGTLPMIDRAIVELRAILDKPVAERKPFAWYRVPKDFPLQGAFFPYTEGQSERDIQNSLEAEFGFNVKRLYDEPAAQHQGEPVAYAAFADNGNIRCWSSSCEAVGLKVLAEGGSEIVPLYPHPDEQPAQIAEKLVKRLAEEFPDSDTMLTVECAGDLITEYLTGL